MPQGVGGTKKKNGVWDNTHILFTGISNLKKIFICYFWLHWVFVDARRISIVVESWGCFLVVVCGLLISVASLSEDRRL